MIPETSMERVSLRTILQKEGKSQQKNRPKFMRFFLPDTFIIRCHHKIKVSFLEKNPLFTQYLIYFISFFDNG